MDEQRKGRQTPTRAIVLPYDRTHGQEAIDLYNSTGRSAQQWQELQLYDILSVRADGLWVHTKYGYSVPRRNGKSQKRPDISVMFLTEKVYNITGRSP